MYRIFTWKLSTTIIHCCIIVQQYTQYNDTTACVNWPYMKKCVEVYKIFTWKLSTTNIRCCIIFQQYTQYTDTRLFLFFSFCCIMLLNSSTMLQFLICHHIWLHFIQIRLMKIQNIKQVLYTSPTDFSELTLLMRAFFFFFFILLHNVIK